MQIITEIMLYSKYNVNFNENCYNMNNDVI